MTVASPGGKVVFSRDGLEIEMHGHLQTICSDRLPGARVIHAAGMDPLELEEMLLMSGVSPNRASQLAHSRDWFVLFDDGEVLRLSRDECRRQAEIAAIDGWYAGQHYVPVANLPVFAKPSLRTDLASLPDLPFSTRTAALRRSEFVSA
jgi:hypothetical protein